MRIQDIDTNFKMKTTLAGDSLVWHDRYDGAMQLHGGCVKQDSPPLCRMPPDCLDKMTENVRTLAWHTAGMRVRFQTDSEVIAIKAGLATPDDMSHMPRTGSSGFDLYEGRGSRQSFLKVFVPDAASDIVTGEYRFATHCMRQITLNLPLYNGVNYMAVGLEHGASILDAEPYSTPSPIVYYGSSITQGGCASRPGNAYQAMLSRLLDVDFINLGFSGSALGEPVMAEIIAALGMSAFVMDYDHNAPDSRHLQQTHFNFFNTIRSKNPSLPIVMLSRPDIDTGIREHVLRRGIVFDTYRRALLAGDDNVYFVDGERLFGSFLRDSCTVDGCHPNDLGFARMAEALYPTLEKLLD